MTATRQIPELSESDKARFWAKVNKDGPTMPHMDTPCWEWTAYKCKLGYGQFSIAKRAYYAHRVSFMLAGESLKGEKHNACHACDNPSCCNPLHIFAGTAADNVSDRESKGRGNQPTGDQHGSRTKPERRPRGELHTSSKLTESQVIEIRSRYAAGGSTHRSLGEEYGLNHINIGQIVNRKSWKHVT